MSKHPGRTRSNSEGHQNGMKSSHEGFRVPLSEENDLLQRKTRMSLVTDSGTIPKREKVALKRTSSATETYRICQALLLSCSVLLLCYHGVRHGRTEYSVLENGQMVRGYVHKAIVTLSLGYSMPYSLVSLVTAGMLVYSLILKKPRWSLPSIVLYLADLVCDVSDAVVAIWLFFTRFPLSTGLFYATGTVLLIRTFHAKNTDRVCRDKVCK